MAPVNMPERPADNPEELMVELCEQVDRFNSYWPECSASVTVYRIPFYTDGLVPDKVEPDTVTGEEAISLCKQALRGFSRPAVQHPGSVLRLPGYVELDRLLVDEIENINATKKRLQDAIKLQYPTSRARNAFCRQCFPGRVMLQVYRQIRTTRAPVEALRFSWSPLTYATRTLTRAEVLAKLLTRLESGVDPEDSNRSTALKIAVEKTRAAKKGATFIVKKPRSPYPVATVFHSRGRNAIKKMVPLSLPIFIGPGVAGEKNDIGALGVYDQTVRRTTRSDQKEDEILFKPMYLCVRH